MRSLLVTAIAVCQMMMFYDVSSFWMGGGATGGRLNKIRLGVRTSLSPLAADSGVPAVGDRFVAEVSDIGGTVGTPLVKFSSTDHDEAVDIFMPASSLNAAERLALQTGTVMQVRVVSVCGNQVEVGMSSPMTDASDFNAGRGRDTHGTTAVVGKKRNTNRRHHKQAPPDLLLNNLKTGMQLQGRVVSCTHYAAFVDVGVSRPSKGSTFAPANAMLHRSDIPGAEALVSKKGYGRKEYAFQGADGTIFERGASVTVFVKEVYKNSGRFTVTLDPEVALTRTRTLDPDPDPDPDPDS